MVGGNQGGSGRLIVSCKRVICLAMFVLLCLSAGAFAHCLLAWNGTQAWTVPVSLPGDASVRLKVAPVLRAATSRWGRRILDGTTWRVHAGVVRIADRNDRLVIECAPCELRIPKLSASSIAMSNLSMELQRDGNRVSGWLSLAENSAEQRILFRGELSEQALMLDWILASTELHGLFNLVHSVVPEVRRATIQGRISATGTLQLPSFNWSVVPQVEGFEVYGLGTERLRYGKFSLTCRDQDGSLKQRIVGDGMPGWVALNRMGRWMPRAVLAAEDARFYTHPGYDLLELVPLLANPDRNGQRGASTVTQQLAKNFFVGAEATGARKLRELLYAVEMERTLGKRRILALYLNTVDWGPGLCGIADASKAYFARAPARLDTAQGIWLAGILRNPHRAYRNEYLTGTIDRQRLDWVASRMPRRAAKNLGSSVEFAGFPRRVELAEAGTSAAAGNSNY
ncbi:MAG: hypothetical protein V7642_2420 [Burkholderiales bacterium]